ncbi:MAG: AAA family ATPase [Pseudomonadota bacterium]
MYESFYQLQTNPFSLTPDPKFCFGHSGHRQAREYLEYALKLGEGMVMVTGRPGTGKTTLVESFLDNLNMGSVTAARIAVSRLDSKDLLRAVAYAFDIKAEGHDKATLRHLIKQYLEAQLQCGRRALLVIDEAQGLPRSALDELRLLADLQAGSHQMLQLFLVGQEQLHEQMLVPEMDYFQQRVIANYHLLPLDLQETRSYIEYRLRQAGWQGNPELTGTAVLDIFRFSSGVPRHINKLCNRLLLLGYGIGSHKLGHKEVQVIIEEMGAEQLRPVTIDHSVNEEDSETVDKQESLPGRLSKLAIRIEGGPQAKPAEFSASAGAVSKSLSDQSTGVCSIDSPDTRVTPTGPACAYTASRQPLRNWGKKLTTINNWQDKLAPSLVLLTVAILSITAVTGILDKEAGRHVAMLAGEPDQFRAAEGVVAELEEPMIDPDREVLQRVLDDELPVPAAGTLLSGTEALSGEMSDSPVAEARILVSRDTEIDNLLVQGQRALVDNRLLTPALDSAYHYFRSALRLTPDNEAALAGIEQILERYVVLANKALEQQDGMMAYRYIVRGLSIQPDNNELLALKEKTGVPIIGQGVDVEATPLTKRFQQSVSQLFSRINTYVTSSDRIQADTRTSYQMTSSLLYD